MQIGLSPAYCLRYWRKLFTAEEVYRRHQKVVDVVKGRDPVAIEQTIREHYIESGERMKQFGVNKVERMGK